MKTEAGDTDGHMAPQRGLPPGAGLALAVLLGSGFWMGLFAFAL